MSLNENQMDPELLDILENGKSINAALMHLVVALGGEVELSDTNAQLIDKLVPLLADSGTNDYSDEPLKPAY